MNLELRRGRDGTPRRRWYGAVQIAGKRKVFTLRCWAGHPPASGCVADAGDEAFERSREAALAELRDIVQGERSEADQAALSERIHKARYGRTVEVVRLEELPERWAAIPRRRKASAFHAENCARALGRFVSFMAEHAPEIEELGAVSAEQVRAFMDARETAGASARTWNWELSMLRSLFARLDPHAAAYRDFLRDCPSRTAATIHRQPFTADELKRIIAAAAEDDLLRPLVVCAACSAMRRGDVCRLRWSSVDLPGNFLTVKTAKTGGTVEIPIFPMLRGELDRARAAAPKASPMAHVWPEAARLYANSPDTLDRKLKTILAAAGFIHPEDQALREIPALPPDELRDQVEGIIGKAQGWSDKRRTRTREIFRRYLAGETVKQIAVGAGISPGIVSLRLNELERLGGATIIRRPSAGAYTVAPRDAAAPRIRRGSIRGWHSFRTTWITLALTAGIPMELVRRVTGHQTVDVVLKNYFKPGREAFRQAIGAALPDLLTAGDAPPRTVDAEAVLRLAEKLTTRNAKATRAELVALVNRE